MPSVARSALFYGAGDSTAASGACPIPIACLIPSACLISGRPVKATSGLSGDDPARVIDQREYREYVTRRAMELMQSDFEPATWRAFWATVVEGRPVDDTAAELGITPNAVYIAKGRVLRRLREELAGLLD